MKLCLAVPPGTISTLAIPGTNPQRTKISIGTTWMPMTIPKSSESPASTLTDLSSITWRQLLAFSFKYLLYCRDDAQDEDFTAGGNAHQSYSMLAVAAAYHHLLTPA